MLLPQDGFVKREEVIEQCEQYDLGSARLLGMLFVFAG
jgi:hypothetical protein